MIKKLASQCVGNTNNLKTLEAETTTSSQNITNEYQVFSISSEKN